MYLLDTKAASELRRPKLHGAVLAWLQATPQAPLYLSALALGEIRAAIELTHDQKPAKAAEIEAWVDLVAAPYNVLALDGATFRSRARLTHRQSRTLHEDAMIAATAAVHGLTVVTRNTADFKPFQVKLLDPFKTVGA